MTFRSTVRQIPWLCACLLTLSISAVSAATVNEIVAGVDAKLTPDQREEPGNTARAQALVAALAAHADLSSGDQIELRFAAAGAWLEAGRIAETRGLLSPILSDRSVAGPLRTRAGLMWVASWQLEWKATDKPADFPAVAVSLAAFGDLGPVVNARCATAEAERMLAIDASPTAAEPALAMYDKALALLANEPPDQRVPVYALRVSAMERVGQNGAAVHAWLQGHAADPAAAEALATAMTANERQLGTRAPALALPRLDGVPALVDLANYAGKTVLIDAFATWCKPCAGIAPVVAAQAKRLAAKGVVTIGLSLDTKDSIKDLPAWIARYAIDYPVIGEGAGFDGKTTAAWHIDSIPALILVGPDGTIIANDLLGANAEQTAANLDAALLRIGPTTPIAPKPVTEAVP